MIYYIAGGHYPNKMNRVMENYLGSYYYGKQYIKEVPTMENLKRVILDSGAWSAHASGKIIKIDDYMRFIVDNRVENYITLDVIGDRNKTLANYKIMLNQGFKPIPVYQLTMPVEIINEWESWLICIGGVANKLGNRPKLGNGEIAIIDKVFGSYPKQKFHILGNMSNTLTRWPVYSCDSTSLLHCCISGSTYKYKKKVGMSKLKGYSDRKLTKEECTNKMLYGIHAYQYMAEIHTMLWRSRGVDHWPDYQIKYNHNNVEDNRKLW